MNLIILLAIAGAIAFARATDAYFRNLDGTPTWVTEMDKDTDNDDDR